ncbi:PREDICTED: uncharacterized protein LOC109228040 [Nicotiana attenuata]|uniref:uncharacterized protein LOC109228040 n=1 Tax=Nicotiana attenuata TaxID=49451 RepID=UPI000904DBD8|nr:PREDICTED: uncharacterized protein LOC109228040 [Nicotiana attenuata]
MAETSKTVPKKDKASSSSASRPAKPVVPPTLEEITPGNCIIKKDFSIENPPDAVGQCERVSRYISLITKQLTKDVKRECCWGDEVEIQIPSPDESITTHKEGPWRCIRDEAGSARGKNKAIKFEVREGQQKKKGLETRRPSSKKSPARRLRKRFAQTGADSAHDSPDDEENDDEESALVTQNRKPIEVAKPFEPETSSCGEDAPKEETGKAPASSEVEIFPPTSTTIPEGVNAETPNDNENAPSEELGAAITGHSLSLPTYSEGAIEEANAMRVPDPNKVIEDDPFHGCYTGNEDANDFDDASSIFEEAQCLLSRAIVKFRAELSQCEDELKKVSGEEKALRLICSQKEEELKDLRTALAKAQRSESELDKQVTAILIECGLLGLTSEANTSISQLQQKLDMIGQLRGEVDQVRADCHQWKKNMDQLAADKEALTAQLASAEAQLRGIKAKGLAQEGKIEGLEAELAKARTEAAQAKDEVVQAKAEAKKTKVAADKSITIYLRETAAVQVELKEASDRGRRSNELAKCQARRETLEELHARGFNLAGEIAEAKVRENDARFLVSSDDEDVVSSSGDEEGEEDVPEGEETPEDRAAGDVVSEDDSPGGVTPKID